MDAELRDLVCQFVENRLTNFWLPLLDNRADSIISVWIRHKLDQVLQDLRNDTLFHLSCLGQADDNLDHAESLLVLAQLVQIVVDLLEDERLPVLIKAAALENFSDDMGTLLVNRKLVDVALQRLLDEVFFLLSGHVVENGLDGVRALLVTTDLNEVILDQVQNLQPLLNRAIRE